MRAAVLARRRRDPAFAGADTAERTRLQHRRRLNRDLSTVVALAPKHRDGRRLRKRDGKVRAHLFTFLDHPEVDPDNNSSERELRPAATYRNCLPPQRRG